MILFLVSSITFCLGFVVGAFLRGSAYDNQPWEVLKWDSKLWAYRPIVIGDWINTGDNVMFALKMDTQSIPEDGVQYLSEDQ
tara:strand:- start:240 stop:485 length:246 start_codon:yes stop_codon:yes gene_type:complete